MVPSGVSLDLHLVKYRRIVINTRAVHDSIPDRIHGLFLDRRIQADRVGIGWCRNW